MKIELFSFIDEAIKIKDNLRFEIQEARETIDDFFNKSYSSKEYYVNYSSRIKSDESLKEKIIRQKLSQELTSAEDLFSHVSDIIGCRIECRFARDEADVFRELFNLFPKKRSDGFYQSFRDPRIELRLADPQPQEQKNGHYCYRIDGHFLGKNVLNFELQIKSIVNVFWSEIDHKILYKNYNYVVTEQFVHDIMGSIMGDLNIIDRQMEMLYDHLRKLDAPSPTQPKEQLKVLLGRTIQDIYLRPLRDRLNAVFDFRSSIDLITEFLFARVEYDSRENYVMEFLRLLDRPSQKENIHESFGDKIIFDPPIRYNDSLTEALGHRLEEVINEDLLWNLSLHILFDLYKPGPPLEIYRTFVDYLYFRIIFTVRSAIREAGFNEDDWGCEIDLVTARILDEYMKKPDPMYFTRAACERLKRNLLVGIRNRGPKDFFLHYEGADY